LACIGLAHHDVLALVPPAQLRRVQQHQLALLARRQPVTTRQLGAAVQREPLSQPPVNHCDLGRLERVLDGTVGASAQREVGHPEVR
jgi:hypothetical protein